jgi:hypothetical protein
LRLIVVFRTLIRGRLRYRPRPPHGFVIIDALEREHVLAVSVDGVDNFDQGGARRRPPSHALHRPESCATHFRPCSV